MVTHATIITRYVLNLFQNNVKKTFQNTNLLNKSCLNPNTNVFDVLVLCFDIFRNPHAQNAWVTQKSVAIVLQSRPTSRYVRPISSPRRIEFMWNLREIVTGPSFEAPTMRFLTGFRSNWSSKRVIFRSIEFNKFQSLIFSKWLVRKIRGK